MIVGVCKETFPGERRVALIPEVIMGLTKQSLDVVVKSRRCRLIAVPYWLKMVRLSVRSVLFTSSFSVSWASIALTVFSCCSHKGVMLFVWRAFILFSRSNAADVAATFGSAVVDLMRPIASLVLTIASDVRRTSAAAASKSARAAVVAESTAMASSGAETVFASSPEMCAGSPVVRDRGLPTGSSCHARSRRKPRSADRT